MTDPPDPDFSGVWLVVLLIGLALVLGSLVGFYVVDGG